MAVSTILPKPSSDQRQASLERWENEGGTDGEAHDDSERPLPVAPSRSAGTDLFTAEFEALRRHVHDMEDVLALRFSEACIGQKYNRFVQRSRLVRQARARLSALRT